MIHIIEWTKKKIRNGDYSYDPLEKPHVPICPQCTTQLRTDNVWDGVQHYFCEICKQPFDAPGLVAASYLLVIDYESRSGPEPYTESED